MPLPESRHNPPVSHIHPRELSTSRQTQSSEPSPVFPEIPPTLQLLKALETTQKALTDILGETPPPEEMKFDFTGKVSPKHHPKLPGIDLAVIRGVSRVSIPHHLLPPEIRIQLLHDITNAYTRSTVEIRTFYRKTSPRPAKGQPYPLPSLLRGRDEEMISLFTEHIGDGQFKKLRKELATDLKRAYEALREPPDSPADETSSYRESRNSSRRRKAA